MVDCRRLASKTKVPVACALVGLSVGCSDSDGPSLEEERVALLALPCDDALESVYEEVAAPSPWSADQRGAIVRCAYERYVTSEEMAADLATYELPDAQLTTGAHKVRILYFTERNGEPVPTSGSMYIPSERRGDPSPLLVLGHGSVGLADTCAPSREHPDGFEKDWKTLAYTLAGDGWVSIMPDFPGLGTQGATSWMYSEDEGHAMLDATRAAREVMKAELISDDNALVGHSNGGHAALSAQSMAADYGLAGTLRETLVYSPFWLSNAAWGALAGPAGIALLDEVLMSNTLMYFYGHLDAIEGADHALDAFLPDKGEQIRDMLEGGCWQTVTRPEAGPSSLGIMMGSDAFVDGYVTTLGVDCALNGMCEDPLAATWKKRWAEDRPPPDPSSPIVQWTGARDDFVTPGFQQCGADRLLAQGAQLTQCVSDASHSDIIVVSATEVRAHLESLFLGGPSPAACPGLDTLETAPVCDLPIANSTDPSEP